jgi:hypothetical protein
VKLEEFQASASRGELPAQLPGPLQALWHEARGEWREAHEIVQNDTGTPAAWVHAYLHRREGDLANAGYWYRRARRPMPSASVELDDEWRSIVLTFLEGEEDE